LSVGEKGDWAVVRTRFEDLRIYRLAEELSELAWNMVLKWERFPREAIGRQVVECADSIGANIAEGAGRGTFADNRRFARIARRSLFELKHWLRRAYKRGLLSDEEIASFRARIDELTPKLSAYINSIGMKASRVARDATSDTQPATDTPETWSRGDQGE